MAGLVQACPGHPRLGARVKTWIPGGVDKFTQSAQADRLAGRDGENGDSIIIGILAAAALDPAAPWLDTQTAVARPAGTLSCSLRCDGATPASGAAKVLSSGRQTCGSIRRLACGCGNPG